MGMSASVCCCVRTTVTDCQLHRYLLVQHPHVSHLPLVVVVQPPQLLAGLLHVVVLPDQLDVVLPHRLQLVFQLGVLARQTAVQRTEETPQQAPSRPWALPAMFKISIIALVAKKKV